MKLINAVKPDDALGALGVVEIIEGEEVISYPYPVEGRQNLFLLGNARILDVMGLVRMNDHMRVDAIASVVIRQPSKWWDGIAAWFGFESERLLECPIFPGVRQSSHQFDYRKIELGVPQYSLRVFVDQALGQMDVTCTNPAVVGFRLLGERVPFNHEFSLTVPELT